MKYVNRGIIITICRYLEIMIEEGEINSIAKDIEIPGKYSFDKALKYLKKQNPDKTIALDTIQHITKNYRMPLEDFINSSEVYED